VSNSRLALKNRPAIYKWKIVVDYTTARFLFCVIYAFLALLQANINYPYMITQLFNAGAILYLGLL
jgi:hypothetical protein